MSSMTFGVNEEEAIKKDLNDDISSLLFITVKTDGISNKYSAKNRSNKDINQIASINNKSDFKELIEDLIRIPSFDLDNIKEIIIGIDLDSNSIADSLNIDFTGLKDIALPNKSISVNIGKVLSIQDANEPIYLPNISTDVIFNRIDIRGVSIKNQTFPYKPNFPYTKTPITKKLSVHDCIFNNSINFSKDSSMRFENNTFEKYFTLDSIEFNEKFIFIENTFKKECMIINNEFKEKFKFENNNIENELYLINNTFTKDCDLLFNKFTKDCKLSNNTFEKKCILSQNNFLKAITLEKNVFKEVLDLSSSSFAGALYLANSTFKEGIITYNIKFISNDDIEKPISATEYIKNCFKVDSDIENLNNFRLSAGIIKSNLINSHNKIDASIWLAVELFIQTKILSLSKCKTLKDFGEWVVFSISGLVSNHQQNIMRPFGWLIAIFLVTSIVYNLNTSILLPIYSFNFSSPLDFINPFLQNYEIPKKSSSFGFGLKLLKILVNAFVTYIIWHIIQTSRSKIK